MKRKITDQQYNTLGTGAKNQPAFNDSFYRQIVENSLNAVLVYNEDAQCTYANYSAFELGGYNYDEIKKLTINDIVHPEDIGLLRDEINKTKVNRDERSEVSFRIKHSNGTYIWVECSFRRNYNSKGDVIETFINCRNITLRMEAERKLTLSNQRFNLAIDLGRLTWWEWDMKENLLIADLNKLKLINPDFKSSRNSLQELQKHLHPVDIEHTKKSLEDYLNGSKKYFESEFRVKTKNGTWRWLVNKGIVIQADEQSKPLKLGGLVIDITEYKEANTMLSENEEKLRNIFNSSPEAIFISSADLKLIDCNAEALKLFGYEKKEFLDLSPFDLTNDFNRDQLLSALGKMKMKNHVKNKEITFIKKDGGFFNGLLSANAVFNKLKEPKYFIFVVQDISSFKKVEAELLYSKEKAEESDKLKSAFLANMSHEIRTPMNAIIGFSDLLSDPSLDHSEIGNYTCIIKERCNNLLQIVNDILDISRIEANQIELKECRFSINSLLDELYIIYAQKLINEGKLQIVLNLSKDLDDKGSSFFSDEVRLKQVLCNLLDNAVKFTKSGEIEFGYKMLHDNLLEFYVKDTGIGISPEKHQLVFERFRQIDESLDREFGGNGLGLAICKAFVELMNGRIWLHSAPGKGTTFFFTIPVKKASVEELSLACESKIAGYNWANKKILIVEDDRASLAFMKVLFNLTRAKLVFAARGQEAIDICMKEKDFDLVLMDIQLPDINGLEVTRMIKGINKNLPVIAQTAYAMYGDESKCLKAGCDDYISKPVDITDLFFKINRLVDK
ncbi:MAG: PAS domain S-box protein [Bacteroidales bacterium]